MTQLFTLRPSTQTQNTETPFPNMLRAAQRANEYRENHFQEQSKGHIQQYAKITHQICRHGVMNLIQL
jgi:hypothetical protein